jgi:hypothetical protein
MCYNNCDTKDKNYFLCHKKGGNVKKLSIIMLSITFVLVFVISFNPMNTSAAEVRHWKGEYNEVSCPSREDYVEGPFMGGTLKRGCNRINLNEAVASYHKNTTTKYRALTWTGGQRHYGALRSRGVISVAKARYIPGTQDAGVAFYY